MQAELDKAAVRQRPVGSFWVITVLSILTLAYPFIVYLGMDRLNYAVLGGALLLVVIVRCVFFRRQGGTYQLWVWLGVILYLTALTLTGHVLLLRFYPVIISCAVACTFLLSLWEPVSLIERFARLAGANITPNAKRYTRKLTAIWAALLFVNALVIVLLAIWAPIRVWALYCGLVSYAVFGFFFISEWFYRKHYIRTYGQ